MPAWRDQLASNQQARRDARLWRSLAAVDRCAAVVERHGRRRVNFAGNDYLGLAGHPRLIEAAAEAARRWGVGAGASRLVSGHLDLHERIEQRFAAFKHARAALLCPTGFMANLAVLTTLAGPGHTVLIDKLNHASLIDAARASGATVRVFAHLGYDKLERLLSRIDTGRKLIVTDSVFSMDGDWADLPRLVALRDAHEAILIVDEAHGTGVLGDDGSGLAEHQGVAGRIDVTISTASKALGSLGGIVTAERLVIDELVNAARSFIYTTAAPPPQAAAIDAALDVIADEPALRHRLRANAARLRSGLRGAGWAVAEAPTPIVPLVVGAADAAIDLAARLDAAGYLAPPIRPPTVASNAARVRLTVRADHTDEQIDGLVATIGSPVR